MDLVAYVEQAPGAGETVLGERFVQGFGGKGANQAVMAARLGARVAFIGAVGDDAYGAEMAASFEAEGIDLRGLARLPGSSGLAPIWVEADGTNRIVVIAGANAGIDPGVAARTVEEACSVDVLVGQLEIRQAVTASAFDSAKRRGATTVLNPAPAAKLDAQLVSLSDWLVPNEMELASLVGAAIADSEPELLAFSERIGCDLVVTRGGYGAVLVHAGQVDRIEAPHVRAVDTTGAGDALVGAFAVGLGLGWPPIDAVRLGVACASHSVTRGGTQTSFPDRARAAAILARISRG